MQNTQNLIDEVKKEIEVKELAIKKLKIHEMLELIAKKEKEWGDKGKELNALKEQLDNGDFSAVEPTGGNGFERLYFGGYEVKIDNTLYPGWYLTGY